MAEKLYWDAVYEIAMALKNCHPDVDMIKVSLQNIFNWTIDLENFADDPSLANDDILLAIFQEWFEEII